MANNVPQGGDTTNIYFYLNKAAYDKSGNLIGIVTGWTGNTNEDFRFTIKKSDGTKVSMKMTELDFDRLAKRAEGHKEEEDKHNKDLRDKTIAEELGEEFRKSAHTFGKWALGLLVAYLIGKMVLDKFFDKI